MNTKKDFLSKACEVAYFFLLHNGITNDSDLNFEKKYITSDFYIIFNSFLDKK